MRTSLPEDVLAGIDERAAAATAAHARRRPGDPEGRQPVHTLYVPADRFGAGTTAEHGREALRLLDAHAAGVDGFAAAFGLPADGDDDRALVGRVRDAVAAKLGSEPVEDLRIDFEDGYGVRGDDEEDGHVRSAAVALAAALADGSAPRSSGLRVKSFADGRQRRSLRTLDGFLSTLLGRTGALPDGFVVTFPKVVSADHVALFAEALGALEESLGLPAGVLCFEVQIETVESVVDDGGRVALRVLADAAGGRLRAAHFGVFDYTAALGLPAAEQRLDHPACDFARHLMQVACAGTGIRLSDGSTNVVSTGESTAAVRYAWQRHAAHVRHSLRHGFVQGWDLHPAHLASRFATVYAHHLAGLPDVLARVAAWAGARADAGGVLDEPATVRVLLGALRRAVDSGAVSQQSVCAAAGISPAVLRGEAPG